MQKTNAMRILDKAKIEYQVFEYETKDNEFHSGIEIGKKLNEPLDKIYKTLVLISKTKNYYVCIVPVLAEIDLKKAAKLFNEKNLELMPLENLTKVTGYIRGGCSPIGMKKQFKTIIDLSALTKDKIYISGGKIGTQLYLNPNDLFKILPIKAEEIIQ